MKIHSKNLVFDLQRELKTPAFKKMYPELNLKTQAGRHFKSDEEIEAFDVIPFWNDEVASRMTLSIIRWDSERNSALLLPFEDRHVFYDASEDGKSENKLNMQSAFSADELVSLQEALLALDIPVSRFQWSLVSSEDFGKDAKIARSFIARNNILPKSRLRPATVIAIRVHFPDDQINSDIYQRGVLRRIVLGYIRNSELAAKRSSCTSF